MSDTGFTRKKLDLTITLGSGAFGETLADTVTLSGFRMTADIRNAGGDSMGMYQGRVFGLKNATMNQLTTIGTINRAIKVKNTVLLAAGDDTTGMQSVFQGTIYDAWADYNTSPDVAFNIIAYSGLDAAVKPVGATSYRGATDVAVIMAAFATDMNLTFENNSVSATLSNPYFSGTSLAKVRQCARAANILYTIDRGVLAIWNKTEGRATVGTVPLLSPTTGMIGYPALSSKGMTINSLFNYNINYGRDVRVESSIPMACGNWRVTSVAHSLSCELQDGPWFTTTEVGYATGQ